MAKRFPAARVPGIDYWAGKWEYSRAVCERNATIEGVADRVNFQKASASALPFEAGSFDAAVSNLVFHEVSDTNDKREVIKEALRVVRKGGAFAFQDLFRKRVYGDIEGLLEAVKGVEYRTGRVSRCRSFGHCSEGAKTSLYARHYWHSLRDKIRGAHLLLPHLLAQKHRLFNVFTAQQLANGVL